VLCDLNRDTFPHPLLSFKENLSDFFRGSETWTIEASDARRITAADMKYMRRTAAYTWDRLKNKCTNYKGLFN